MTLTLLSSDPTILDKWESDCNLASMVTICTSTVITSQTLLCDRRENFELIYATAESGPVLPVCCKYWLQSVFVTLTPWQLGGWAGLWSSLSGKSFHSGEWPYSSEQNHALRSPKRLWLKPRKGRRIERWKQDTSQVYHPLEKENKCNSTE